MTYLSDPTYLENKILVIEYLHDVIKAKSQEEHNNRMKDRSYRNIYKARCFFLRDRNIKTVVLTKTPIDFVRATTLARSEIERQERHIVEIVNRSKNNKNILEECEQYFQNKVKIHSARIPLVINALFVSVSLFIFFLAYAFGDSLFPSLAKTSIIAYVVAMLIASIPLINLSISVVKPFLEGDYVSSTSVYEECIQLLKCAKVRLG